MSKASHIWTIFKKKPIFIHTFATCSEIIIYKYHLAWLIIFVILWNFWFEFKLKICCPLYILRIFFITHGLKYTRFFSIFRRWAWIFNYLSWYICLGPGAPPLSYSYYVVNIHDKICLIGLGNEVIALDETFSVSLTLRVSVSLSDCMSVCLFHSHPCLSPSMSPCLRSHFKKFEILKSWTAFIYISLSCFHILQIL